MYIGMYIIIIIYNNNANNNNSYYYSFVFGCLENNGWLYI